MRIVAPLASLLVLAFAADPAAAHTGDAHAMSFASGFVHPFGGLDHLLAMLAVGAWAGQMGGGARWSVPLGFVGMMLVGSLVGASGIGLPWVEAGILASVVLLGLLIAFRARFSSGAATATVGLFALCHGHAHGTEMAAGSVAGLYVLGFMAATLLLHVAGIGLVVAMRSSAGRGALRWSGAGIAAAGMVMILAA